MATAYETAAKYLDKEMKDPLRQTIIGRKFFPKIMDIPMGKMSMDYDSITEMGDAEISYDFNTDEGSEDMIKIANTTLKLIVLQKKYKISRGMFEAFRSEGKAIDTAAMLSAMQVVALKEDKVLIQGWAPDESNYRVKGLYQSAGNTTAGADFGTFGNALQSVIDLKALFFADNVVGMNFNLILNPVQFGQLEGSYNLGVYEWDKVMRALNPIPGAPQGGIYQSNDITAATGLMCPVDPSGMHLRLVRMVDMRNELGSDSKHPDTSPIYGTVYEVIAPLIINANAVGTFTAI
jgi:uncharacterized linocin/CFP29 family protein